MIVAILIIWNACLTVAVSSFWTRERKEASESLLTSVRETVSALMKLSDAHANQAHVVSKRLDGCDEALKIAFQQIGQVAQNVNAVFQRVEAVEKRVEQAEQRIGMH